MVSPLERLMAIGDQNSMVKPVTVLLVSERARLLPQAEQICTLKNPTQFPTDHSDTTGQPFFDSRMIPTPPDQSDHPLPLLIPRCRDQDPGRSKLERPSWYSITLLSLDPEESYKATFRITASISPRLRSHLGGAHLPLDPYPRSTGSTWRIASITGR